MLGVVRGDNILYGRDSAYVNRLRAEALKRSSLTVCFCKLTPTSPTDSGHPGLKLLTYQPNASPRVSPSLQTSIHRNLLGLNLRSWMRKKKTCVSHPGT